MLTRDKKQSYYYIESIPVSNFDVDKGEQSYYLLKASRFQNLMLTRDNRAFNLNPPLFFMSLLRHYSTAVGPRGGGGIVPFELVA